MVDPSRPPGDGPCPKCGSLIWFDKMTDDVAERLAKLGAFVEADDSGQVVSIRFAGDVYDDSKFEELSQIVGLHSIDIRETKITERGAS